MEGSSSLKKRLLGLGKRLQDGLIENMFREYKATGALWEQYDQDTGKGKRGKPFTGWSSLVLLLMSDDTVDLIMAKDLWDHLDHSQPSVESEAKHFLDSLISNHDHDDESKLEL